MRFKKKCVIDGYRMHCLNTCVHLSIAVNLYFLVYFFILFISTKLCELECVNLSSCDWLTSISILFISMKKKYLYSFYFYSSFEIRNTFIKMSMCEFEVLFFALKESLKWSDLFNILNLLFSLHNTIYKQFFSDTFFKCFFSSIYSSCLLQYMYYEWYGYFR